MSGAEQALRAGAAALQLQLDDDQLGKLWRYVELIAKWSKVYNLTAVREPLEIVRLHILDSLAVVAPLRARIGSSPARVLDVGAGAGLPGVVLAIAESNWQIDCVDAVAKKMAFVQQVAAQLELDNLRGLHARVEDLQDSYDVVTSRAFASLADFVTLSQARLQPSGIWMAMKGKLPEQEIAELPPVADVFHVEQLSVPGLDAQRCIVWMRLRDGAQQG